MGTGKSVVGKVLEQKTGFRRFDTDEIISSRLKTPIEEMRCPRRDMDMRVITKPDGSRSLVEWKIKPEAKKLLDEAETLYQAKKYEEAGAKQVYY